MNDFVLCDILLPRQVISGWNRSITSGESIDKNQNFHGAVQSNNTIFAGLNQVTFWPGFLINQYM